MPGISAQKPFSMKPLLLLATLLCSGHAAAAESAPLALRSTEVSFQTFIARLKAAAAAKDAAAVYAVLAPDYTVARDFGGAYDPAASPVANFSATFEFDNDKLRPEYRDHGWTRFTQALRGRQFERKRDGQLCTPHGALDRRPFPHPQLCFRKHGGDWTIQSYINGGD